MIIKFNENDILTISDNIGSFVWNNKVLNEQEIKELYLSEVEQ